ncbi:hypothetical protein PGTUg99_007694 [Puccinia graminis f. sp. tritici]|uniref:Peptidase A2 domain-containing protein n=1 Tax=Puccinia graminis f. sp. tritici TaxID=56615 RepID=A0A5B0S9H6_PUCGR|nr:hypothetical protein PGTUg99_007694 [Puccinia graminis f. sp. tritici]
MSDRRGMGNRGWEVTGRTQKGTAGLIAPGNLLRAMSQVRWSGKWTPGLPKFAPGRPVAGPLEMLLEGSKGSRLLVPASFRGPGGVLIPATILVDTGAMANFVNESFIRQHDLKIRPRNNPIRCVGFDGREGVGGLVTQDWAGMNQLSSVDAKPFTLQSSFGITRLGSVDTIFGLPWLDRQGWVASGSLNGGHQFTLGSTPLYVIKSASVGGKPGDELYTPSP